MQHKFGKLVLQIGLEAIIGGIVTVILIVTASVSVQTFTFVYQGF